MTLPKEQRANSTILEIFCPQNSHIEKRTMEALAHQENVVPAERHYAVIEVAELWNHNRLTAKPTRL